MSVLRRVAPFGSYHWPDRTFVAELALHGPFHNLPDFLYFRRDHPMRTSRVGRNNIRRRCADLDPARANRWRHPVVRLVGEYLLAYLAAIWRAPLSPTDRWRCMKELSVWVVRHANPMRKRRLPESPYPAVQAHGAASLTTRPSQKVSISDEQRVTSVRQREGNAP